MRVVCPLLLVTTGLFTHHVSAFDYQIDPDSGEQSLTDVATGIVNLQTMFTGEPVNVSIVDLNWNSLDNVTSNSTTLFWTTTVDGIVQDSGNISLADVGRQLPSVVKTGTIQVNDRGTSTVLVELVLDDVTTSYSENYQVYKAGVSIIPLIIVLVFAMTTRMVEFSLFLGIFVGACIVTGTVIDGFKRTLDEFILQALADEDHVYVILFTLFLSGLVSMMQKSGGLIGFTKDMGKIAKTPRLGQLACFLVGLFIFFDDYANVLLAGETMRPLLDTLCISREKLAFIVDGTSAPVASISPVSSWVGFEVGLIQNELDKIIELEGTEDIGIKTSGFGVFLQSIKYRYYPIFMLVFVVILIFSERDSGPMLVAERKARVYQITDGGDGKGRGAEISEKANQPRDDTPKKTWNMVLPVLLLIALIFYILVETGTIEGTNQTFMDKIENSDSYSAMLWGTAGTAVCTMLFYLLQIVKDGRLIIPRCYDLRQLFCGYRKEKDEDTPPLPRFLMSVYESVESLLFGMGRIFPAIIVLTLAWASGAVMVAVGADRLFANWIIGGVAPEALPTLSFIVSLFMALATGTSWGTMSILFPLLLVPTYIASDADELIFYATVAGVLSGSVAGDHMSPISDTTVLSSLACDCNLVAHVITQAPYAIQISVLAILCGTLPIGYDAWPNMVGYVLGWFVTLVYVYTLCRRAINKDGSFGPFFELYLKFIKKGNSPLEDLRIDTVKAFNGEPFEDDEDGEYEQGGSAKQLDESDDEDVYEGVEEMEVPAYDEDTPDSADQEKAVEEMESYKEENDNMETTEDERRGYGGGLGLGRDIYAEAEEAA